MTLPLASIRSSRSGPRQRLNEPTSWWLQMMGRLKPGVTLDQVRGNLGRPVSEHGARRAWTAYTSGLTAEQRNLARNQHAQRERAAPRRRLRPRTARTTSTRNTAQSAIAAERRRRARAADRVRERRQPAALARDDAAEREIAVRLSMGATRGRLDPAAADREPAALVRSADCSASSSATGAGRCCRSGSSAPLDWRVLAFVARPERADGRRVRSCCPRCARRASISPASMKETQPQRDRVAVVAEQSAARRAGRDVARAAHRRRALPAHARQPAARRRRLQPVEPADVPRSTRSSTATSPRASARVLRPAAASDSRRCPACAPSRCHAHALLSGSTSSTSTWAEGIDRGQARARSDVRDDGVAGVLRDDGDPDRARSRLHDAGHAGVAEGRGAQRNGGARRSFPTESRSAIAWAIRRKTAATFEIVGVVRDTKYSSLRDAAPPTMFYCQRAGAAGRHAAFVVRTAGDPPIRDDEPVRAAIRQIDPTLPLRDVTTQADQLEGRFAQERLFAMAYSLFGGARAAARVHRALRV